MVRVRDAAIPDVPVVPVAPAPPVGRAARARLIPLACVALAAATLLGAAACTDAPATPTPTAAYSQSDLRVGTGADAVNGGLLSVNYTGWLYDASRSDQKGLQFDTSLGQSAFAFTLGSGQVIKGWDQGLVGMKVGGLRRLVIPPSLAYGDTRSGLIPPNSTLVFEVELVSVQ